MGKEIITSGNTEIKNQKFHCPYSSISIYDVDINKIIVPNKVTFGKKGFKYFIWHEDNENVVFICIRLPRMSGYRKNFEETEYMYFLIKDEELLKIYDKICEKVSNTTKKGFDSKPKV